MLNPLFCWRSSIARNSSLLTGFIENRFAGKDRKKPFSLKWVFYRGLTPQRAVSDCCCNTMLSPKMAGSLTSARKENSGEVTSKIIPRDTNFVICFMRFNDNLKI